MIRLPASGVIQTFSEVLSFSLDSIFNSKRENNGEENSRSGSDYHASSLLLRRDEYAAKFRTDCPKEKARPENPST